MGRKGVHKRQASVDARKQILKVRGDYLELSDEEEDDDDEVIEITEAPAKKYKVSARKSDGERNVLRLTRLDAEPTLEMEVWVDELSPAQLAMRNNALAARAAVQTVIEDVVKQTEGRLLLDTVALTALELTNYMKTEVKRLVPAARPGPGRPPGRPRTIQPAQPTSAINPVKAGYSIVLDPRTSAVLGPPGSLSTLAANASRNLSSTTAPKKKFWKTYGSATSSGSTIAPIIRTELPPVCQPASGGVQTIVDLTTDDNNRSLADTKEVSFNRLQGKTFPSLVVVARPSLRLPQESSLTDSRNNLDRKVKKILIYSPAQFAEYLIQQGLVKSEHLCQVHTTSKLKLGMYSDASRFPFSGGYIWISECCPPKFVSVFHESMFDGTQPPTTNFKLIYHWACQTNVQNILQWVKVENVYLKSLYTYLRGICTVALHTHMEPLGSRGGVVEIGVISLGTTSQDGANRHVKVEVLGVLDTQTRKLMLRAADPNDGEVPGKNNKKRFIKILEPLLEWVHYDSTIVIDMTIEKQSLHTIGFNNVVRNGSNGYSNQTVMDYLRRIVPRMFQNTLSLLSRQIIQQFLDELVWRETYGTTPYDAFHNILKHISEQTRVESTTSLFTRLTKVTSNPFKNWSVEPRKNQFLEKRRKSFQTIGTSGKLSAASQASKSGVPKQLTSLEPYYYGTIECNTTSLKEIELEVQCPTCSKSFDSNITLLLHLLRHVANCEYFCKYCLTDCGSKHNLYSHMELKHSTETKAGRYYTCLICHDKFNSVVVLGKHMCIEHAPAELPYHCGSCNYKSSCHKFVVDHFYKQHANHGFLQCPLCLLPIDLHDDSGPLSANVTMFMVHLQAHFKRAGRPAKIAGRKCARCDLQFLTREEYDDHVGRHKTYKNEPYFIAFSEPKGSSNMVPKSLRDEEIKDTKEMECAVTFDIPEDYKCKECDSNISESSHFQIIMYCQKGDCKYQTLCRSAMTSHKAICSTLQRKVEPHPLDFQLFCVCGFTSRDGNVMARHLSICERKSAYPTRDAAEKASITPDMLDVLGLVRKFEDSKDEDIVAKRKADRRRKRRWVSDDDSDDPDYEISDEDLRTNVKKQRTEVIDLNDDKESEDSLKVSDENDANSNATGTDNPPAEEPDEALVEKVLADVTQETANETPLSTDVIEVDKTEFPPSVVDASSSRSQTNDVDLPLSEPILTHPMDVE